VATIPVRVAPGRTVDQANKCLGDIVDIGEIPSHLAVIEELDRLAGKNRLGKDEHGHVWPPPRAINREKAKACGRDAIQVTICMRHQLVGLF
jgi:hypothetical protein